MKKLLLFLLFIGNPIFAKSPELMLVEQYQDQDISGWVMSEKLDGVRGFWDGQQLISRQGYPLNPPDYFIQDFPPFAIDGELFSERGKFEEISSIVRSAQPKGWHKLKLQVFDVPNAQGNLIERLATLENYLKQHPTLHIAIIEQIPIKDKAHLQQFYQSVLEQGGEGVIVRNPNAGYIQGRSAQILKIKPVLDEECTVVAHHKGKGNIPINSGQSLVKINVDVFGLAAVLKIKNEKIRHRLAQSLPINIEVSQNQASPDLQRFGE